MIQPFKQLLHDHLRFAVRIDGRDGLAREQLYEGRDLAVTTDFRSVLGELVTRQLGNSNVATVFPGFRGSAVPGMLA